MDIRGLTNSSYDSYHNRENRSLSNSIHHRCSQETHHEYTNCHDQPADRAARPDRELHGPHGRPAGCRRPMAKAGTGRGGLRHRHMDRDRRCDLLDLRHAAHHTERHRNPVPRGGHHRAGQHGQRRGPAHRSRAARPAARAIPARQPECDRRRQRDVRRHGLGHRAAQLPMAAQWRQPGRCQRRDPDACQRRRTRRRSLRSRGQQSRRQRDQRGGRAGGHARHAGGAGADDRGSARVDHGGRGQRGQLRGIGQWHRAVHLPVDEERRAGADTGR